MNDVRRAGILAASSLAALPSLLWWLLSVHEEQGAVLNKPLWRDPGPGGAGKARAAEAAQPQL